MSDEWGAIIVYLLAAILRNQGAYQYREYRQPTLVARPPLVIYRPRTDS